MQHEDGRGLRNQGDEDPICSLRSLSEGSTEEHQGTEEALNLTVTLKVLTSSPSPSRERTLSKRSGPPGWKDVSVLHIFDHVIVNH